MQLGSQVLSCPTFAPKLVRVIRAELGNRSSVIFSCSGFNYTNAKGTMTLVRPVETNEVKLL